MMSEEELAEGCTRGDRSARKELYDRYASYLMALCLRYVGDREAAEDVLHDGYLKVYASFHRFNYRGEGSLRSWLSKILVNESLSYLRRTNRYYSEPIDERTLTDDAFTEPDPEAMDRVPQAVLMDFIRQLPDGYRAVFNLYVFENKSHKEIGQLLHIQERSSSSQFYRARMILIKKINDYLDQYDG